MSLWSSLEWAVYNLTAGRGERLADVIDAIRSELPNLEVKFGGTEPAARGPTGFDQTRTAHSLGFRPETVFRTGVRRTIDALRLMQDAV